MSRVTTDEIHEYLSNNLFYGAVIELGRDNIQDILEDMEIAYVEDSETITQEDWDSFVAELLELEKEAVAKDMEVFVLLEASGHGVEISEVLSAAGLIEEYGDDTAEWLGEEHASMVNDVSTDDIVEYLTEKFGHGYVIEIGRDNPKDILVALSEKYSPEEVGPEDWFMLAATLSNLETHVNKTGEHWFTILTADEPTLSIRETYPENEFREVYAEDTYEWLKK